MTDKISPKKRPYFFVNLFPSNNLLKVLFPSKIEIFNLLIISCLKFNSTLLNGSAKNSKKNPLNRALNLLNTSEVINRNYGIMGISFLYRNPAYAALL